MGVSAVRAAISTRTSWLRVVAVVAVVLVIDQVTKALVRNGLVLGEKDELTSFLSIEHVHNSGVAFGFLGGGGALVLVVTIAALALLVGYFGRHPTRPLLWLPTGLLLGGAIGNLIDRVRQGYVTDFITFPHFPSFNAADTSITCGVVILVLVLDHNARSADA